LLRPTYRRTKKTEKDYGQDGREQVDKKDHCCHTKIRPCKSA